MTIFTGSCLCGAVKIETGPISDMTHCHCSMCRKTHGTPFATYAHAESIRWISGRDSAVHYQSSPALDRYFCKHCGAVLPDVSPDGEGGYLPVGMLDNDPVARPLRHIFVESKASWYPITDELPQVNGYGEDSDQPVIDQPDRSGQAGDATVAGSCLCQAVRFEYTLPDEFMYYCHCSRCRKVKGAGHASNVFVKPGQFRWVDGEDNITVYNLPGAARFGNSFCNTCGSSMPRQAAGAPLINVPAGSLDDAPGVTAHAHIYVSSMAPWFTISDSIAQFEGMPPR